MEGYSSNMAKSIYLIGNPLKHSISPQIHNAALRQENLPYVYKTLQVTQKDLPALLEQFRKDGTVGFNVTIPFKTVIMEYLDEIKPVAQQIGAVNTVKIENGKLIGTNTDIDGIRHAFTNSSYIPREYETIVLVGAGGAARAVALFFSNYKIKLVIINRTVKNAEILCNNLASQSSNKADLQFHSFNDSQIDKIYQTANLIINATPVGMYPNVKVDILANYVPTASQRIFDLVYNPLETQLVQKAKQCGCNIINGLDMLLYQAAEAFNWWTGNNPDVKLMKKVAFECLQSTSSE
jgi:shikimate dehydrogenase